MSNKAKKIIGDLFALAGVKLQGDNPWDIQVKNDAFYSRVLSGGSLALGESYMDGWWDCERLDEFAARVLKAELEDKVKTSKMILKAIQAKLFNLQTKSRAKEVMKKHYNLTAALYMSFLDSYNQYTCGYFKDTENLNEAQEKKLDLICKKLQIKKEDKVLDIGCGWGGFAKFASEKYGCHVTGISLSDEQIKYAKEYCKGLPVEIIKSDYRNFKGKFDKILVCGMIEHVGYKNYRKFMKVVDSSLKPNGLFLLHTIGSNKSMTSTEPWMNKYIFPNSMVPSAKQITAALEGLFISEDWHNFGTNYDKTLMAWHKNFNENWNKIKDKYDERFFRMWNYYLLCCAGLFRSRKNQLWQIVLSKHGVPGGYKSIR
ncbi:cyclopropane fatty acyl phospholipid synthase [bacterium]|nr:cyclopropane fatty acyl phospholipid synthase [bacterium]